MTSLPPLTWVLCDQRGEPLPGGQVATNRRLVAGRNQAMEARLSLSLYDQAARELFAVLPNGLPQLRVYLSTQLVFAGYWTPMRGSSGVDGGSTVELVFRDGFARLATRYTQGTWTYVGEDAGLIAMEQVAEAKLGFGPGIDTDPAWIEPTKLRDRIYPKYKNIGEIVTELTEVLEGFDWFPVYTDSRFTDARTYSMEFHVAAHYGTDRPTVIFEYGTGTLENCTSYSFATSPVVNRVVAIGAGTPPLVEIVSDTVSRSRYGTTMQILSATDVVESATLIDKATDALRLSPVHVTEFKPDPALSPLPWRDFWIGDTVRWNVDDGAFQQHLEPRVQTIEVGIDDSDNISELVVGIDPAGAGAYQPPANTTRAYVKAQRELLRRLNAIERG